MTKLLFIIFLSPLCLAGFSQPKKGKPAPEIALSNMEGNQVSLADLKGRVVLIDFWASWCGPCRYNNPRLVKLYQKYHEKGFEILGVSLDNNPASWKQAVQQDKLEWIQVNDNQGWDASVAKLYRVNAIPVSFLIDKEGIIREIDMEGRALESKIKSLLKN
jgi:peroxiredoxin